MSRESNQELISILTQLIKELKINVNASTVRRYLRFHPHGNSLLSISSALSQWNIQNAAYNISMAQLHLIPTPFISKFAGESHQFLIVQKVTDKRVHVYEAEKKKRIYAWEEFSSRFSGIVLAVETDERSGEFQYRQERINSIFNSMRIPLILLLFTSLVISFLHFSAYMAFIDWRITLLILSKVLGIFFCAQLMQQVIFKRNAVCRSNYGTISCEDVLSSDASKILWKQSNWAEAGMLYFSGTFLILLLTPSSASIMQLLSFLSIACIPYTVFSIYYQRFVIHKWCLLCSMVQCLLWVEAILLLKYISYPILPPGAGDLEKMFACFIFPLLLLLLIKPLLYQYHKAEIAEEKLSRFLYNERLFQLALTNNIKHELPDKKNLIILGDKDAARHITIVLSPFCASCAAMFHEADHWLASYPDSQLTVLFKPDSDPSSAHNNIIRDLLAINQSNKALITDALRLWFRSKDYKSWSSQFRIKANDINVTEALLAHYAWCAHAKVTSTPMVYVDGYELPQPYDFTSIQYLIK